MEKFTSCVSKIWEALVGVGRICILVQMVFIVVNIVLRRFFNQPVLGSTEIVRYIALVGASFALSSNEWLDGNMRVTIVHEIVPERARRVIDFIVNIIVCGGLAFVGYYLIQQAMRYYSVGEKTLELGMSTWIFALILALGMFTFSLCGLSKAIICGYKLFSGGGSKEGKA
ncbi:MAG: TRAP transporter small permease [Oscillospiraceae bacterium]|nr:TRAP transporter small permease [Oscillospiraceae bacterium]